MDISDFVEVAKRLNVLGIKITKLNFQLERNISSKCNTI